jgi:dephospho-CoA kinase
METITVTVSGKIGVGKTTMIKLFSQMLDDCGIPHKATDQEINLMPRISPASVAIANYRRNGNRTATPLFEVVFKEVNE